MFNRKKLLVLVSVLLSLTGCSANKKEEELYQPKKSKHTKYIQNLVIYDLSDYLKARDFSESFEIVNYGTQDYGSERWEFKKQIYYPKCTYRVEVTSIAASKIYNIFSCIECVDPDDFASIVIPFQSKILQIALKGRYSSQITDWFESNIQGEGVTQVIDEIEVNSSGEEDDSGIFNALLIRIRDEQI